ncbi:PadR-family transcriptional regulator [Streptomyces sp. L-9-10]|uniref:PadR family transcriptional regulator n=1 Tax=Streptomyces sp. L-9-10 TaxID=1478131 RepID=UPI00101D3661|nr:PadR family transcriptional regulator [Streptomyces sp. L-9-10]RYJ25756.1 PadR-family transcriptional regulator [Streptomyces sp. L-9-10]
MTEKSPTLPPTSWAVLGLLSFGEELSGYDLKKWADSSLKFFYWSPSYSQIYSELKRLERAGYAVSRVELTESTRGKRVYTITGEGREAVTRWARDAPVEPPILKHGVMLRVWLGHLMEPEKLRAVIEQHRDYADKMRKLSAIDAEAAAEVSDWAYPEMVLRWSERHYESERDLAQHMLNDLDALAAQPRPQPTGGAYARLKKQLARTSGTRSRLK